MRFARSMAFMAVLASTMTGCLGSSTNSRDTNNPLSAARGGVNPPSAQGGDCEGLPTAPESLRVDLDTPAFSNPLDAFNPLFPVGELDRVVLLGESDGEPFRTETTRLPGTRTIVIDGQPIETIISQYVAWKDRRIAEVALDWYGQDDEGNVWYFGEDVFNYEDGVVVDMEGTWIAGDEFPVAMIMPAAPQVGDVWRPENACPIVFEEVTALETNVTVIGPSGPVAGALLVKELHLDGLFEDKTFAPGYGEFSTGVAGSGNVEALAVAVPTDFIGGEVPEDLDDLADGAERMFNLARRGGWRRIASLFEEMEEDWDDYEMTGVPPLVAEVMGDAMDALDEAIIARDRTAARQAAVDIALAGLDFELLYEDRADIDLDLIEVWTLQLQLDQAAHDRGGVRSDLETIRVIRDRLAPALANRVDLELSAIRSATNAEDEGALMASAAKLNEAIAELTNRAAR
ncbi:MAG: hypothetical protein ACKVU1_18390 [bacterium]